MSTETEQQDLSIVYVDVETRETAKPTTISFKNSWTTVTPIEDLQEGLCPLCGVVKELAYEKINQGYAMRICEVCTMAYIESAKRIDSEKRLEPKIAAKKETRRNAVAKEPKPFLVRVKGGKHNHWIDIQSGMKCERLDVPYDEAQHGLCEKTGKIVLKKLVNDGFEPLVFVAKEPPKPTPAIKPITVKFHDADKKLSSGTFESYDIQEVLSGLDEGLNERELAIRVCSNQEAIGKLIEVIGCRGWDLKNEGGDRNGRTKRNKGIERRPQGTNNRACVASRR